MGDFFAPPSGFAPPPPEPDTPAPKIEDLAASLGIGLNKSGAFGSFLSGLVDALLAAASKTLGMVLTMLLKIMAWIIGVIGNVNSDAAAGYGAICAATLNELFGVEVSPTAVSSRQGGADKQAAATAVGRAIAGSLFSTMPAATGSGVPPSDAAADAYLAKVMQMELAGWVESWFVDGISGHLLEKYGDLKDGIGHVMGLGRMSRQAFAPPLKVFVHDPYQAALDQKFRPKPVNEQTAMRAFFRGEISTTDLSRILGDQGYSEQYIQWLITDHKKFLPDADVDYLISRGLWQQSDAVSYLQEQGWDTNTAPQVLAVLADKRIHKYRLAMVQAAEEAFIKGDIAYAQWQNIVETAGITDDEQTWIMKVAGMKREMRITHLSLGQIAQGVKDGILSLADVKTWADRNNMPADEEAYLELMVQFAVNKQTAGEKAKAAAANAKAAAAQAKAQTAATKAAAAKAQAADKGVSATQAETLVKDGIWTIDQLTAFLAAKGYGPDAINAIVNLVHAAMNKAASSSSTAATVKAAAAAKGLSLAEVEKAVVAGILTTDDLSSYLTSHGFDAADAQVIVELTQDAVAAAKVKAEAKTAAAAKAALKGLSLSALERAVRLGITPIDTYTAALQKAGFDQMSQDLLLGILRAQMAQDASKATVKGSTSGKTAAKAPTLAQIEAEVVAAIRPIGDFTAQLAAEGYSPGDQTDLTQLLQLKVDHAKHAAALHSDAQGKAVAKGISLASAEAAIVSGLNTMADYDAMLVTLGYDDIDRQTLEALLTEKIQAKAAKAGGSSTSTPAPAPATSGG